MSRCDSAAARSSAALWLLVRAGRTLAAPAVPVDGSLPKRRRIWVPGINPAFWQTDFMRQELDAILTVWPT